MRLSAEQVKEGILHERRIVRDFAVDYFTDSYSRDPDVMPCIIEAVETYGWDETFVYPGDWSVLPQTEETLRWVIDQLENLGRAAGLQMASWCGRLSRIVCHTDVDLLAPYVERILSSSGLWPDYGHVLEERLDLAGQNPDRLWSELVDWCDREKDHRTLDEVELGRMRRVVEALGRHPAMGGEVMAILFRPSEELSKDPSMIWMEPLTVELAGRMRLEAAVPHLVDRLWVDADWFREKCNEALGRIGADETADRIAERFPGSEWHCRLFASATLRRLRSDRTVAVARELAVSERNLEVKENLIQAVLSNVAAEGIDLARPIVRHRSQELRQYVLAVSFLVENDFPERDHWLEDQAAKEARIEARQAELSRLGEINMDLLADGYERLTGKKIRRPKAAPEPAPAFGSTKEPGRNDPCPCGSGKKYKKCCLRKR